MYNQFPRPSKNESEQRENFDKHGGKANKELQRRIYTNIRYATKMKFPKRKLVIFSKNHKIFAIHYR